jgi:hypothetical protein
MDHWVILAFTAIANTDDPSKLLVICTGMGAD